MVINMISEIRRVIHKQSENFNKRDRTYNKVQHNNCRNEEYDN